MAKRIPVCVGRKTSESCRLGVMARIAVKREMGISVRRACFDEGLSEPTYYLWLKQEKAPGADTSTGPTTNPCGVLANQGDSSTSATTMPGQEG